MAELSDAAATTPGLSTHGHPPHDLSALVERVNNQGNSLTDLRTETSRTISSFRTDVEREFSGIANAINKLDARIETLATDIHTRGRVNWLTLAGVACAAVGTIVTVIAYIEAVNLNPIREKIDAAISSQKDFMSRADIQAQNGDIKELIRAVASTVDKLATSVPSREVVNLSIDNLKQSESDLRTDLKDLDLRVRHLETLGHGG